MSKKQSGFLLFMKQRRANVVASGQSATGELAELIQILDAEWTALPQEDKQRFIETAKQSNHQEKKKYTGDCSEDEALFAMWMGNLGSSKLTKLERIRHFNREYVWEMFATSDWKRKTIVACTFSLYIDPKYPYGATESHYLPAEIALTAFSIELGVKDNFSRIIDIHPALFHNLPVGHQYEMRSAAKKLGFPCPPGNLSADCKDYLGLLKTFHNFLILHDSFDGLDKELYVFACDKEFEMVTNCLDWLNKHSGSKVKFRVFSLSLFAYLTATHRLRPASDEWFPDRGDVKRSCQWRLQALLASVPKCTNLGLVANHRVTGTGLNREFHYPSGYPFIKFGIFLRDSEVDQFLFDRDNDNYKFEKEICCVYHYACDTKCMRAENCALNKCNRIVFNILDVITFNVQVNRLVPGGHFPQIDNLKMERRRRHAWLRAWGLTSSDDTILFENKYKVPYVVTPPEEF